ncbi:MAG: cyclase family protein [Methanocorpusculum sp.]|nr:cyclase family protein [Methanocorpusculum sp.]
MKLYDVSRALYPGMPVYPGDPEFTATPLRSGESFIAALSLGTHTGTHIDAPAHYFAGAGGVDAIPLASLVGEVEVARFPDFSGTAPAVFFQDAQPLSAETARELVARGITAVGCDTDSIGGGDVHRILLQAGVAVIECLDLRGVRTGMYRMAALPLKIAGGDAAPARVILIDDSD